MSGALLLFAAVTVLGVAILAVGYQVRRREAAEVHGNGGSVQDGTVSILHVRNGGVRSMFEHTSLRSFASDTLST